MLNITPNSKPAYQHVITFWEAGRFYNSLINISNYMICVLESRVYNMIYVPYYACTDVYRVIGITFF